MKYYISFTKTYGNELHTQVTGGKFEGSRDCRHCVYFVDQKMPENSDIEDKLVEVLFNNPMTKRQANSYYTKLISIYNGKYVGGRLRIREFPDNITLSQFDSFIRW